MPRMDNIVVNQRNGGDDDALETAAGRLERWQGNLLDLTLRNRLLNFGERVSTIQLLCPDQARLLKRLSAGAGIQISEWSEQDTPERAICEKALSRNMVYARLVKPEQRRNLKSRLLELYRRARRELQEGGANTLYLVIDVLVWKQSDDSDRELVSPLVLVPIELTRKSASHDFEMKLFDDAPRFNPTLLEMLRRDFGADVSSYDNELIQDIDNIDLNGIHSRLRRMVEHMPDFKVHSSTMLDTLSFGKYLMWKDLVDRTDDLRQNRVVQHILDSPMSPYPTQAASPEPRELDGKTNPAELFTPLSADSSQLAAVVAAERGNDFVMIGPPGTGKSQTISNMIAHNLAKGKSVLFVSEKVAALEVVYRRLQNIGLGEFCLELHSNKARKLDVIQQLGQALDASGEGVHDDADWLKATGRLGNLRDDLNQYVERLHASHRNGFTVQHAFGEVVNGFDIPYIRLHWPSSDQHDQVEFERLCGAAERLGTNAVAVGNIGSNPLAVVANGDWSPDLEQRLVDAASLLIERAELVAGADEFAQALGSSVTKMPLAQLTVLRTLAGDICSVQAKLPDRAALLDPGSISDAVASGGWSLEWAQSLVGTAQNLGSAALDLAAAGRTMSAQGLVTTDLPIEQLRTLAGNLSVLAEALYTTQEKQLGFALLPDAPKIMTAAHEGIILAEQHQTAFERLSVPYNRDNLMTLNHAGIKRTWDRGNSTWWPRSAWLRGQARKALQQNGGTHSKPDAAADLPLLDAMASLRSELEKRTTYAAATPDWRGLDTNGPAMRQRLTDAESLLTKIVSVAPDAVNLGKLAYEVSRLITDASQQLIFWERVAGIAARFSSSFDLLSLAIDNFDRLAQSDSRQIGFDSIGFLDALTKRAGTVSAHRGELQQWCGWLRAREVAISLDLKPLVDAVERNDVVPADAERVFRVNYCRWWANAVVSGDDLLRRFVPAEHDSKIADFRNLDETVRQLSPKYIRSRLNENIPLSRRGSRRNREYSELGRLLRQRRPRRSLRQIFSVIPTALRELTPCLLMSPLSVAQYLPADHPQFDLVIFDEASQIPPWDAVGAMARGHQVIVAGDPKQLPPTTFFNRTATDEDDNFTEDDIQDLESILEELEAASLPKVDLKWHYRSESESLIAFPNRRYYENKLITFPTPVTDDRSVRLVSVPGRYERGSSRTNMAEARAVVAEIVKHFTDPNFCDTGRTIGVVTFNTQQQTLIEDLLDEERRNNPDIEPYFSDDRMEPVFVKNLESVQGDERDVILFSITYGPDVTGTVSMNFGPLNREGGQRRLNVAITRARSEMQVFSSLRSEQMDISRTQSEGVRDLKDFLNFAERGTQAFVDATSDTQEDWETPFERAVANRLQTRGWTVHPQIGVSSYRIDIGVVHPDAPGRYLVGVECDGATYHSSATARDRDKLREEVLRGKGWKLLRVWSTDFWNNPDSVIDRVDARIKQELEHSRGLRPAA